MAYVKGDTIRAFQYFQILRFCSSLILSVLLIRCGISMEEVGIFEILIFLSIISSAFWLTGISQSFTSLYASYDESGKNALIKNTFVLLAILGVSAGILLFLFIYFSKNYLDSFKDPEYIGLLSIYVAISAPVVLNEHIYLVREQASKLFKYANYSYGIYLALMTIVLLFVPSVQNLLIVLIFWSLLRLILTYSILAKIPSLFKTKIVIWPLILISAPLILNGLVGFGMDYVDNLLVLHYFDTSYFPVFRYGARELPFASLLLSALSTAMIPVLVKNGLDTEIIRQRTTKLMHFLFPVAITLMFISPLIFPLVYNDSFKESAYIFNIYLMILLSRILLPQTYNYALKQNKTILISGLLELLCNILLSIWWVQHWGVFGLAMATVVSYMLQKLILLYFNFKVNGIKPTQIINFKWYGIYSVALIAAFLISFIFKY